MKIGTIGTGSIVELFIAAARQHDNCEIAACYSRKQKTGEEFATKLNIAKIYTDMDMMFQDSEIDFIYVASPNSLHYLQSKKALLAGKNVICEKPFTSTVEELDDLIQIAKEKGLYLFEAIIPIHLPNFKWLKQHVHEVGDLKMIQCNFSQYSSRYDAFKRGENPNVFNAEFSGGALMDINLYNIHFTMGLFGIPKSVHYFANIENGIDTSGTVILDYGSFKSTCVGAKDSKSKNMNQIQGDKGYFIVDQESSRCVVIESHTKKRQTFTSFQDNPNGMYYEIQDFLDIVAKKDYQACYDLLAYSKQVLEVVVAARQDANIVFVADQK